MILLLFTILLSSSVVFCTEIITFENKTHFVCATPITEAPIYVIPPVVEESKDTSLMMDDDKLWNDNWLLKNSTDVSVSAVEDKRWQDFGIIKTNQIHFDSVISLSFSNYGSISMNVTVSGVEKSVVKGQRAINLSWSLSVTYGPATNSPIQITAETEDNSWWKIHFYKLRWAETVSQEPTTLTVSPNETSCLVIYVYVCSYCILDIYSSGSIHSFCGDGRPSLDWRSVTFTVESERTLKLVRNTTNGQEDGQWGVDIRHCPIKKSGRAIYDVQLHEEDTGVVRACDLLNFPGSVNNDSIFDCDIGSVGTECDIHCEDLLGPENRYCQKHKICDSSLFIRPTCSCAWGYQGDSCDQACSDGSWGLSCQRKCSGCSSCNRQTGGCLNSAISSYFSKEIGFAVSLGLGILHFLQ